MANVKIDENGDLRCWKCGSKNLESRRKASSKAAGVAVGALVLPVLGAAVAAGAKKRIRCIGCGEYNDPNPEPWQGAPEAKKSFAQRMQESNERKQAELEAMREKRALEKETRKQKKEDAAREKIAAQQAKLAPPTTINAPVGQPAAWYRNPDGSPTLRWWDGHNWTKHVQQAPQ